MRSWAWIITKTKDLPPFERCLYLGVQVLVLGLFDLWLMGVVR